MDTSATHRLTFTDPTGNTAITSRGSAGNALTRVGVAFASGLSGFAFGYTCGYLNAITIQGLDEDAATFQAARIGLLVGSIDFAASITFSAGGFNKGFAGKSNRIGKIFGIGLFVAGASALGFANSLTTGAASEDNFAAPIIDGACFAASAAGGFFVGNRIDFFITARRVAGRTTSLLNSARGVNLTPIDVIAKYDEIGRSATYLTDLEAIESIIGPLSSGQLTISRLQALELEIALGLDRGTLSRFGGFVISLVEDVQSRNPVRPSGGNDFFKGLGQGLPEGSPEIAVDPIPTNPDPSSGISQIFVDVGL